MFRCRNAYNLCFRNLTKTVTTLQIHFGTQDMSKAIVDKVFFMAKVGQKLNFRYN